MTCDLCGEEASYAYLPSGKVWPQFRDSLRLCWWHLTLYYLGLHYVGYRQ